MERFFSKAPKSFNSNIETSGAKDMIDNYNEKNNRAREVDISDDDIIVDPGLRKSIDSYPVGLRDELRRKYLVKGPCQPRGHNFPATKFGEIRRSFQDQWFKTYDWLEYSVSKDAAYCLWCYLFSNGHKHGDTAFTEIDQRSNVDYVMMQKSSEMEDTYRIRLTAVVKVIRYILKQGLAFRGHDESTQSICRGNFLELYKWYGDNNDKVGKVIDINAPGNNQLTSPYIQKQIINACSSEVRSFILAEIEDKWFSLLIDEARDSSIKEQMSLNVTDTSKSLKNSIDEFLAINGLSLSMVRGQGYDETSNMRGQFNGLKALILKENENAYYVHCLAHQLQLVIISSVSQNGLVSNFFEYLSMIVNIVGASCKRRDELRQRQFDDLARHVELGDIATRKGMNQSRNEFGSSR
ncbi:uncharacterized protein LOC127265865 [Andrographis paniculata]|uniref:uncharacterized protein LOC127265865 n=1 Tax=Andrographis paniculata TaxID=175694 RepID=UPI0021E84930|nr:uncharacterized protein LOC127265865 [Andrographis paniculata]